MNIGVSGLLSRTLSTVKSLVSVVLPTVERKVGFDVSGLVQGLCTSSVVGKELLLTPWTNHGRNPSSLPPFSPNH